MKEKHIKHWDLFNTIAASARIDEAIESMLPDQFEILLYKKNSEYSCINLGGMKTLLFVVVGVSQIGSPPSHPTTLNTHYSMNGTVRRFRNVDNSTCYWLTLVTSSRQSVPFLCCLAFKMLRFVYTLNLTTVTWSIMCRIHKSFVILYILG